MKRLALLLLWLAAPVLRANYPWTGTAPADIAAAALTPDTVLDEQPCNWRPALTPIASRLVHDCNSAREAVLQLAARLSRETGVHYSTSRRKHNMNALEALAEKKVSCTGQSILAFLPAPPESPPGIIYAATTPGLKHGSMAPGT